MLKAKFSLFSKRDSWWTLKWTAQFQSAYFWFQIIRFVILWQNRWIRREDNQAAGWNCEIAFQKSTTEKRLRGTQTTNKRTNWSIVLGHSIRKDQSPNWRNKYCYQLIEIFFRSKNHYMVYSIPYTLFYLTIENSFNRDSTLNFILSKAHLTPFCSVSFQWSGQSHRCPQLRFNLSNSSCQFTADFPKKSFITVTSLLFVLTDLPIQSEHHNWS